jgi:hypothetical protein
MEQGDRGIDYDYDYDYEKGGREGAPPWSEASGPLPFRLTLPPPESCYHSHCRPAL